MHETWGSDEIALLIMVFLTSVLFVSLLAARRLSIENRRANLAKSQFLSSMSHELRTPLNSILGFGQLLAMDTEFTSSEHQKIAVNQIISSGRHLLELIDQILDLSRIEQNDLAMNIGTTEVEPILADCLTLTRQLASNRDLVISTEGVDSENLPKVLADPMRLKQVLLNLVVNAVKYNTTGVRVTIRCSRPRSDYLRIAVDDDGPGIASEKHHRVFKVLDRLGAEAGAIEGHGIGLALSKEITELMNGAIGFTSAAGQGATFWVDIPISRAPPPV